MNQWIFLSLILAFSHTASAECISVDAPISFTCKVGERQVNFSIATQKICGGSFWGVMNHTTLLDDVQLIETPNGDTFEFNGPHDTRMSFDSCVKDLDQSI